MDIFKKTMEEYKKKKGQKIIFIHGKGEGVLRQTLIHELNYRYKSCTYQDASFQEYGYGATQVTIKWRVENEEWRILLSLGRQPNLTFNIQHLTFNIPKNEVRIY